MPLSKEQIECIDRLNPATDEVEHSGRDLTAGWPLQTCLEGFQMTWLNPKRVWGCHPPRNRFIKAENVFRADKVRPSLPRGKALGNAPGSDGEHFLVPGVIR